MVYEQEPSEASSLMQVREYFQQIWELECSRDYVCEKETKKIADARTALEKRYEKLPELYPEMLVPQDWEARTMETDKVTLLSNPIEPENKAPNMWYALNQLMKTGEQVTVYTPYIICGVEMYRDLEQLCQDTELMLVVDSPELNQVIRKEAEHDKTYSRVMTSGGMYEYGENYEPREMSSEGAMRLLKDETRC